VDNHVLHNCVKTVITYDKGLIIALWMHLMGHWSSFGFMVVFQVVLSILTTFTESQVLGGKEREWFASK
jgi:hypothetical protein